MCFIVNIYGRKMLAENVLVLFVIIYLMPSFLHCGKSASHGRQGPSFVTEPPSSVEFLNTTGAAIVCSVQGQPMPIILWIKKDGSPVTDIEGIRHVRPDGTLIFSPFSAEEYRQDVHSTVYRCTASNVVGAVSSRDVHLRALVSRNYETQVYDEFVTKGNTAVLKCQIPTYVKEYVSVISWIRDDGFEIRGDPIRGDRYSMFPTGELYVRHVDPMSDGLKKYYCQTKHRVSGEVKQSSSSGSIVITDPHSTFGPRISDRRASHKARQGETVELPCAAQGYPIPQISWIRIVNGQLKHLSSSQRIMQLGGSLVIRRAKIEDSGKYICSVNNSVSHEKIDVDLLVMSSLYASIHPRQVSAEEGETITLNCTVKGHPISSLMWVKNLNPVIANTRIRYLSRDVLQIAPVMREDKGMYQCFVNNDFESVQAMADLSLGDDPPILSYTFHEETLEPGPFLSLKCSATGTPLPQITWSLDDMSLTEGIRIRVGDFVTSDGYVNSFVNITSLRPEDGGIYECSASNDIATVSHSARINVFGPPLVKPMRNVSVLSGNDLVLRCPVSGYPIERIVWEKGSNKLPQNRRQNVFQNGTMIISNVDRTNDEGKYRCTAENKAEETAFRDINVKVLISPVINPFHFPGNLKEGMRVIVSCSVLEGDPPITLRWYKDSQPLLSHENMVIDSSNEFMSTIFLKHATYENNGNYTCLASNAAGSSNHTATMIVNVPPQWRIPPSDKAIVVGNNVIIDCQADGFPQPRIWWEKSDGSASRDYKTIISNSHIYALENGSLMIRETEQSDAGFYLCQATNGIGSGLSKVINLNVHVAAYFKSKFMAKTLKKGDTANLNCEAFGESPINILWSKDRQPFDPATDARYELTTESRDESVLSKVTVHSVDRRDSALFTCVASNKFGQDDTNIQVIIQEPPDSPSNILATEISSRSINLRWAPPYTGNSPIISYKIQVKLVSENWGSEDRSHTVSGRESSTIIRGLQPISNYNVRMLAENSIGWSETSQVVQISTGEEAPEGMPISVHAIATSSNTVHVSWKPPKKDLHNGLIRGYYVGFKPYEEETYLYKTVEVQGDFKEEIILTDLYRATKYSVIIQAFNSKGSGPRSEPVIVETLQIDPPEAPVLTILSTTSSSIHLKWSTTNREASPITGYVLYFKKQFDTWEERQVPGHLTTYTFQDLYCGSHYQFYIVAYNNVGKGNPSEVVAAKTLGSAPNPPKREALLNPNATAVAVYLNAWLGTDCPVNFFVVQYKATTHRDWILVSNNVIPEQKTLVISELTPGTWYTLLMIAHSEAGQTEHEYVFATMLSNGATIPPLLSTADGRPSFYKSLTIVVPGICAAVVLFVILIVFCVVVKKRRTNDNITNTDSRMRDDKAGEGISMAVMERKHTGSTGSSSPIKDQLYYPSPYAMSHVPMFQKQSDSPESDCSQSLRRGFGQHEHIYDVPYPPKWREDGETYSHILENSNVQLHPSTNMYQSPRVIPIHSVRTSTPTHRARRRSKSSQRLSFKVASMASEGHSGDESENEVTTYMFNRDIPTSYLDSHEMSEAECDRDLHELCEKSTKYQIFEQYDGQRICIT